MIAGGDGVCKVCLAEFLPDAMYAVSRTSLMRNWTPKAHSCYTWGLICAGHVAEALLQLGDIDHAAFEHAPGCVANCFVMKGRALRQLQRTGAAINAFRRAVLVAQGAPTHLCNAGPSALELDGPLPWTADEFPMRMRSTSLLTARA